MRPVFPPVTEIERAQRCWNYTNKYMQGLKAECTGAFLMSAGWGLFCRFVEQPEGKITDGKRRRGKTKKECVREREGEGSEGALRPKHLYIRVKLAEPPVHNKPLLLQYQEIGPS